MVWRKEPASGLLLTKLHVCAHGARSSRFAGMDGDSSSSGGCLSSRTITSPVLRVAAPRGRSRIIPLVPGAMPIPSATYRVQLHAGFGFDAVAGVADYLSALGVSHLYASPYLQANVGSTHGYDVLDHSRVSQELGSAEA